ncbi:MAG: XF1762 family protein [Thermoplasmata archaeon]
MSGGPSGTTVPLRIARTHNAQLVRCLIRSWHSTHPAPVSWRVAFLLYGECGEVIGVSTFGRPVARAEDRVHTMEHTRMALGPAARKNSASWFMAACRRWIRAEMPGVHRLIAYVDETRHTGVTYRADNWRTVYSGLRPTGNWGNRPGRAGEKATVRRKFERPP